MAGFERRFNTFAKKFEGHEAVLRQMVELFLQDVPARMAEVREGLQQQDWPAVSKAAHSLVNITGTMQVFEAAKTAKEMDIAVEDREYSKLTALFDSLDTEITSALAVLQRDYSAE